MYIGIGGLRQVGFGKMSSSAFSLHPPVLKIRLNFMNSNTH